MALLQSFKGHIFKTGVNTLKLCSAFTHSQSSTSGEVLKEVQETKKKEDQSSFTHSQSSTSDEMLKEVQETKKKEDQSAFTHSQSSTSDEMLKEVQETKKKEDQSAFAHSRSSTSDEMLKEVQETKKKEDLSSFTHRQSNISEAVLKEVQKLRKKEDLPIEMKNPFVEEKPKCLLCKYDIEPNFRNVRLLSQFVSSFTGRVYGRHITGLCEYKQKLLEVEIRKAQTSGLMGVYVKDPNFLADPDLYDPTKPFKVL